MRIPSIFPEPQPRPVQHLQPHLKQFPRRTAVQIHLHQIGPAILPIHQAGRTFAVELCQTSIAGFCRDSAQMTPQFNTKPPAAC